MTPSLWPPSSPGKLPLPAGLGSVEHNALLAKRAFCHLTTPIPVCLDSNTDHLTLPPRHVNFAALAEGRSPRNGDPPCCHNHHGHNGLQPSAVPRSVRRPRQCHVPAAGGVLLLGEADGREQAPARDRGGRSQSGDARCPVPCPRPSRLRRLPGQHPQPPRRRRHHASRLPEIRWTRRPACGSRRASARG